MTYTHGHHESVLRSHTWRTAENSSAYLLPHLRAGQSLLDVGCGPGTITSDLALLVAPGETVGIDAAADVVARAREHAAGVGPRTWPAPRWSPSWLGYRRLDVIHLHQVLQHLADPRPALGGAAPCAAPTILAARDGLRGLHLGLGDRTPTAGPQRPRSRSATATTPVSAGLAGTRPTPPGFGAADVLEPRDLTETQARAGGGRGRSAAATTFAVEQAGRYGLSDAEELEAIAAGVHRLGGTRRRGLSRHPCGDPGPGPTQVPGAGVPGGTLSRRRVTRGTSVPQGEPSSVRDGSANRPRRGVEVPHEPSWTPLMSHPATRPKQRTAPPRSPPVRDR